MHKVYLNDDKTHVDPRPHNAVLDQRPKFYDRS